MKKLNQKIVLAAVSIMTVLLVVFSASYMVLNKSLCRRFTHQLVESGFHDIRITGFKTYFDGVVVQKVELDQQFVFNKIYLHGKPWQLQPSYIHVFEAVIATDHFFVGRMPWPFKQNLPVTIEKLNFAQEILGEKVVFSGHGKQNLDGPMVIDFSSDNSHVKLDGQAEIKTSQNHVQNFDITLNQVELDLSALKARRAGGWISFAYTNGWSILGELESGFLTIGDQPLLDAAIKLNGSPKQLAATMTGREQATPSVWNFDLKNNALSINRDEQAAFLNWQKLDEALLGDIAILMQSLRDKTEEELPLPQ